MQLIEKIIKDVSAENVVQIVTDHKTCINLMLKDIGEWPDYKACIESAKRICSWLYNSNSLHHMMKKAIGGELVKWNATRFGTNYMFLDREEEEFRSDNTTPEPSGDDGGRGFDGDDDDEDDTGGSDDGDAGGSGWVRGSGGAGGSSGQVSPLHFTGETNFTHATQDQDHGAPTSQRQTRSGRRARSTPKYAPHLQLPPPYRGRLPPPPLPQQPIHLNFWLPSAYGLQVYICLSVFIQSFVHLSYSLHLINVGTIL